MSTAKQLRPGNLSNCFTVRDITKVTDGNNSSFVKNLNASINSNLVL